MSKEKEWKKTRGSEKGERVEDREEVSIFVVIRGEKTFFFSFFSFALVTCILILILIFVLFNS